MNCLGQYSWVFLAQVQSPVDSATMSPVERTAAWVLNNGQYEEDVEETEQNPDEAKHAEKVEPRLSVLTYGPAAAGYQEGCLAKDVIHAPNFSPTSHVNHHVHICT